MSEPLSPATIKGGGRPELPAYLSNGVIGLRVRESPLRAGLTLLNGYTGVHAIKEIEAAAVAPYPLAGDIRVAGIWLSDAPERVVVVDQSYDFACGELTSRFEFHGDDGTARVEVLTFCSRDLPSLVCQQIEIEIDRGG